MKLLLIAFIAFAFFGPTDLAAQPSARDGRVVVHYFLNPVTSPQNLGDVLRDCLNNDPCNGVVNAVAAKYAGIPPGTIEQSMNIADDIGFGIESNAAGEESHFSFEAADGYEVCHALLSMTSIAPAGGDRSPQFATTMYPSRMDVTIFVPRQGLGKGRSWFEGVLSIVYSPLDEQNRSDCRLNNNHNRNFYVCKGHHKTSDHDPCFGEIWIPHRG